MFGIGKASFVCCLMHMTTSACLIKWMCSESRDVFKFRQCWEWFKIIWFKIVIWNHFRNLLILIWNHLKVLIFDFDFKSFFEWFRFWFDAFSEENQISTLPYRLKPVELDFLKEYHNVMQPVAATLDSLQGDLNCFFGMLLPTLVQLRNKLKCLESARENHPELQYA